MNEEKKDKDDAPVIHFGKTYLGKMVSIKATDDDGHEREWNPEKEEKRLKEIKNAPNN